MCDRCISNMVPRKELTRQCRVCFRSFELLSVDYYPSRHDPTICNTCWQAGTVQARVLADQTMSQVDVPFRVPQTVLPEPDYHPLSGMPLWQTKNCVTCQKQFSGEPLSTQCFQCLTLSPDAPTEVTPQGGKHSSTGTAFHHFDPELMLTLSTILYTGGQKYGRANQYQISVEDHLNHALTHIFGFLAGDTQDDHLEHAILRLMFAATVQNSKGQYRAED